MWNIFKIIQGDVCNQIMYVLENNLNTYNFEEKNYKKI